MRNREKRPTVDNIEITGTDIPSKRWKTAGVTANSANSKPEDGNDGMSMPPKRGPKTNAIKSNGKGKPPKKKETNPQANTTPEGKSRP